MKKLKRVKRPRTANYKEQSRIKAPERPKTGSSNKKKFTQSNLLLFIQTLRETCCVSTACKEINISPSLAYTWRKNPKLMVTLENGEVLSFAVAWKDAIEIAVDKLERECRRWALDGQPESVVYQGQLAWLRDQAGDIKIDNQGKPIPLTIHMRSPRMMEILLKAHRPKFRDKPPPDSGEGGGAGVLLITMATNEETWEELAKVQQKIHREELNKEE